ncbi:hypothetical protein ACGFX3_36550, partial [Streptomyces sioyaensis]
PGRLSFSRRGSLGRLRAGFTTGMKLTAILACPSAVAMAGYITFSEEGWARGAPLRYIMFLALVAGAGLAVSVSVAVHAWLDAPPERATGASPLGLLRQDRASSVAGALTAGVAFGLTVSPLTELTKAAASMGTRYIANTRYGLPAGAFEQLPTMNEVYPSPGLSSFPDLMNSILLFLIYAAGFALLILLTRAWPRFLLLRLFLAARGKLPWRILQFLADVRDRQLLRQSAGAYQFRHIRLQERLAGRSLAQDRAPRSPQSIMRRRIRGAVAITATLLACTLTVRYALPEDPSHVMMKASDAQKMVFAPGRQHLVTLDHEGTLHRWNTRTGEEETSVRVPRRFMVGNRLPVVTAWKDGLVVLPPFPTNGNNALLYPWDGTPSHPARLPPHFPSRLPPSDVAPLYGHVRIVVSPGGRYLLIPRKTLDKEQQNELRDTVTGKSTTITLRDADPGQTLLSANGKLVAYQRRRTANDWVVADTQKKQAAFSCTIRPGHDVGAGAINAAGTRIAAASQSTILIYDNQCHLMRTIATSWSVSNVALNDAGTELAATSGSSTLLYWI